MQFLPGIISSPAGLHKVMKGNLCFGVASVVAAENDHLSKIEILTL